MPRTEDDDDTSISWSEAQQAALSLHDRDGSYAHKIQDVNAEARRMRDEEAPS